MSQEKITPELKKLAEERLGASDEQIEKLTDTQWRVLKSRTHRRQYRMVAEVIEVTDCCSAGHKKGDKYVYTASGFLLPEESTVACLCLWAMRPMLPFIYISFDRTAEGLDPTPKGWDRVHCPDVGMNCGGLGRVVFRIYSEKAPQP
jgi:uncharacterized repeat protein (TIGR04076 family)